MRNEEYREMIKKSSLCSANDASGGLRNLNFLSLEYFPFGDGKEGC